MTAKCIYFMIFWDQNEISNFEASLCWVFPKDWEPVINISWLKNEQVKVCFFTLESPYPYFCCNLRHNVMPYMYSEMQNKLSKTRDSPLESMGQIISSRCPYMVKSHQKSSYPEPAGRFPRNLVCSIRHFSMS